MRPPESWGHSTVDTACPLDCPDACSLAVTVEKGRLVAIDGSPRNEITDGFICAKVRRFGEHVYGDTRLKHPAIRSGRKGSAAFKRASWDDAMAMIADRMLSIRDAWGAEAILPFCYGGSNGLLSQDTTDATLWRAFGTSRLARTVCAAPTGAANLALYGKMPCVTYGDYVHARLIVIWGANPSVSGIHLVPYVREAQRRGAVLVVIDPRETPLAKQADLHLAVKPGSDVAVALSVHRYLFENGLADLDFLDQFATGVEDLRARAGDWTFERAADIAGVPADTLRSFAELYGKLSPAVIRCGWGIERNRNGGNAALAILALPAVAGKFRVRGGGFSMSNSGAWGLGNAERWIGVKEPATRLVNMNQLGRALTEYETPPVKMLFVYNCNPLATMPDQNRVLKGLEREDLFTVVFEQVMNDTARYADVVLPATTFLETYDIVRSYGSISMQLARPVIDAVGESRPNVEVFSELCRRVGVGGGEDDETEGEALLRVAGQLFDNVGEGLLATGIAEPPVGSAPIQFVDVFPRTSDQKIHLYAPELAATSPGGLYAYTPDPATASYPLTLISPASDKTISSTLGQLIERQAAMHISPADAAARNIADGDTVRVFNDLGEVQCFARVDASLRAGTVSLVKGLWRKSTLNGQTANALCPDTLTDLGGGACFNDARVDVALVPRA